MLIRVNITRPITQVYITFFKKILLWEVELKTVISSWLTLSLNFGELR